MNTFGFKAIANVVSNDNRAASTDIHHADRSAGSGSVAAANGVIWASSDFLAYDDKKVAEVVNVVSGGLVFVGAPGSWVWAWACSY